MTAITLGKLPYNWIWTTVGDLVSDVRPGFASGKKDVIDGIEHLRMNNISSSCTLDLTDVKRVPQELAKPHHILFPGDILFCHTNSLKLVGKTALFDLKEGKYAFSNHLTRLRVFKDGPIPEWIWYGLATLWRDRYFETRCKRWVNQATVDRENILSAPIPLPPLEEQKRILNKIIELFSQSKVAKESIDEIPPIMKNFRQTILASAFRGKLTERDANDEPTEKLLERIRSERKKKWEENLKIKGQDSHEDECDKREPNLIEPFELPKGWKWIRVKDISEKIQYGSSKKTVDDPRGIPVLRMGNIQDGNIIFEDLKYLLGDDGQLDEFILHDGDVLFNRTNSADLVGKSAVYKNPYPKAAFASYLIKVKVNKDVYDPDMLSYFINSPYGRKYISSVATQQVGQANVNGTKLSIMPVPLPPRIEQRKMVERIQSLISMVNEVEESVRQADYYIGRMNASVLAKAFTGKLVSQDPKDEAASIILERINTERKKESGVTKFNGFHNNLKQMTLN